MKMLRRMLLAICGVSLLGLANHASALDASLDQSRLPILVAGYRNAASLVNSGIGKVVVHTVHQKNDGGVLELDARYTLAFAGKRARFSVETEYVKNYGGTEALHPDERLISPGTIMKEDYAFDGQQLTVLSPLKNTAVIGDRTSQSWAGFRNKLSDIKIPGHGIVDIDQYAGKLPDATRSEPKIVGKETLNGDDCSVVEIVDTRNLANGSQSIMTRWYWIDSDKGFTVPKILVWSQVGADQPKVLCAEVTSEMRLYPCGLWGPEKIICEQFGQFKIEVTYDPSFNLNAAVSDSELTLKLPNGTDTYNEVLDAHYAVP